eukprot:2254807-Karenia_brevis.AAC.3
MVPRSLKELQDKAGIKLVLTDGTDPDNVGYIQWRVAFYVAGGLDALFNFLYLLDDFFIKKSEDMARETPFEVHLHPHTDVNIEGVLQNLTYELYKLHDPEASLTLGIFEAQPVNGKRIIQLHLQPENETHISILVLGNTWKYNSRLDAHGVPGAYYGEGDNRIYIRILKSIDVTEEKQQKKVFDLIGDKVFKDLAMRVVLDSLPQEKSKVECFVRRLKQTTCLHFVESTGQQGTDE